MIALRRYSTLKGNPTLTRLPKIAPFCFSGKLTVNSNLFVSDGLMRKFRCIIIGKTLAMV